MGLKLRIIQQSETLVTSRRSRLTQYILKLPWAVGLSYSRKQDWLSASYYTENAKGSILNVRHLVHFVIKISGWSKCAARREFLVALNAAVVLG